MPLCGASYDGVLVTKQRLRRNRLKWWKVRRNVQTCTEIMAHAECKSEQSIVPRACERRAHMIDSSAMKNGFVDVYRLCLHMLLLLSSISHTVVVRLPLHTHIHGKRSQNSLIHWLLHVCGTAASPVCVWLVCDGMDVDKDMCCINVMCMEQRLYLLCVDSYTLHRHRGWRYWDCMRRVVYKYRSIWARIHSYHACESSHGISRAVNVLILRFESRTRLWDRFYVHSSRFIFIMF